MKVTTGILITSWCHFSGVIKEVLNFMKMINWFVNISVKYLEIIIWFFFYKPSFKRNVGPHDRPLEEFEFREPDRWNNPL